MKAKRPVPKSGIKRRGFGSMPKARLAEITKLAGQAAQASGKGHRWTKEKSEEAKAASKKAIAGRARAKALRLARGVED